MTCRCRHAWCGCTWSRSTLTETLHLPVNGSASSRLLSASHNSRAAPEKNRWRPNLTAVRDITVCDSGTFPVGCVEASLAALVCRNAVVAEPRKIAATSRRTPKGVAVRILHCGVRAAELVSWEWSCPMQCLRFFPFRRSGVDVMKAAVRLLIAGFSVLFCSSSGRCRTNPTSWSSSPTISATASWAARDTRSRFPRRTLTASPRTACVSPAATSAGRIAAPTRAGFMTGRYQQRSGTSSIPGAARTAAEISALSLSETTIGDRSEGRGLRDGLVRQVAPRLRAAISSAASAVSTSSSASSAARMRISTPPADTNNPILRGTEPVDDIDYTTDAFGREAGRLHREAQREAVVLLPGLQRRACAAGVHGEIPVALRQPSRTRKRRTFAAMLSAMDDDVGPVLAKIREHGPGGEHADLLLQRQRRADAASTTSGNGPLRGFKSQTWEGGIRIPFMVQWKGRLPAGKVDDRPVIQLDIHPTALAAAGVESSPSGNSTA